MACEIELKLPPAANCESKAWFACDAVVNRLPGTPGAIGLLATVKAFNPGTLNAEDSASPPGSSSAKIPPPIRTTVLSLSKGRHAIPILGSQTIVCVSGYAFRWPDTMNWL